LTLTPISKRGKPLFSSIEPEELRELRTALSDACAVPEGDTPPAPVLDWRADWHRLAGFDLPGLCVPEPSGGSGHRVDAAVTAAKVLGAALHGAPYAGIAAATAALGASSSAADLVANLLPDLLTGKQVCGFGEYDASTGTAYAVAGADDLDALLLHDPTTGTAVLLTDPTEWSSTPSLQGGFDVTRSVTTVQVAPDAGTRVEIADPRGLHRLLLAADALGGVERSLDRAVAYSRTRTAFGTAIGGFQAVQHRLVDHSVRVRGMALAVAEAAHLLTRGDAGADRAVLVAEAAVSAHAVGILHDLVQLTGGIGFTWEHGLHLFERRAQVDALLAGNPRRALADLAETEGWRA